jgi:hypothetical protein
MPLAPLSENVTKMLTWINLVLHDYTEMGELYPIRALMSIYFNLQKLCIG